MFKKNGKNPTHKRGICFNYRKLSGRHSFKRLCATRCGYFSINTKARLTTLYSGVSLSACTNILITRRTLLCMSKHWDCETIPARIIICLGLLIGRKYIGLNKSSKLCEPLRARTLNYYTDCTCIGSFKYIHSNYIKAVIYADLLFRTSRLTNRMLRWI